MKEESTFLSLTRFVSVDNAVHAYEFLSLRSNIVTVPSLSRYVLPSAVKTSSNGAPTNTAVSVMNIPLPKSSLALTLFVTNLSSITNSVSYFVAVNTPPDPILRSTISVSPKSNVVVPLSKRMFLLFPNFSAPITILFFALLICTVEPNLILVDDSGAVIVCCKV